MTGARLRLCPFCGGNNLQVICSGVAAVWCDDCGATGPSVDPYGYNGYLLDKEELEAAQEAGKERAIELWNRRPHIADLFPEDLDEMEKNL